MKNQSIQINMRLVGAILTAAGLIAMLLLFISLDASASTLAPPQVLAIYPESNSHDAEVTTRISITYDQDMDPLTVDWHSFAIHARQTGWLTETLSVDGGMIMLQPTDPLHAGELVQVSATTDTLSIDGEAPMAPTVWEFTTKTWGGNANFHQTQSLANDANTYAALGDIDGDGDLDAVTTSCWAATKIYQNDGDGTFTEIQSFDYSYYCHGQDALGDIDGDGDLDAVLIGASYDTNNILLNDGTGHFTESAYPILGAGDYGELGDLDGDGDLDLIITSYNLNSGTIWIWKNDGAGIFSLTQNIDTAYELCNAALGDLDGDGDLDTFVAGWYNGSNVVYLNDSSGNFSQAQAIPNANTYWILLGDLDNDGDLDAYMANSTYEINDLPDEVWLNDGTGHFTNSGQSLQTPQTLIPGLGDLDADGDLDAYLSDYWNFVPDQVWVNDGLGNFSFHRSMDDNLDGGLVFLGDLDGDGSLDAFTSNNNTDIYIFLNGDWTHATDIPHTSVAHAFAQCPDDPDSFYIVLEDTLRYHVDNGEWETLAPPPDGWWLASAVCYQGKIYLVGGEYYGGQNKFSIYDIATDTWSRGPDLPRYETGAAVAAWDGKIFLIGGSVDFGGIPINQVDVFDIVANTWTADALPHLPVATAFSGFTQTGPYIYMVGGFSGDYDHNVNATQRLDLSTGLWETGPTFTSARAYPATAISDHHIYATGGDEDGGSESNSSDMVELINLTDWPLGSWQDLNDPLPKPSQANFNNACTEALAGGEIWSIGGTNRTIVPPEDFNTNLYYPTGEPCMGNIFSLALAPESQSGGGQPGSLVTYSLTLTNAGDIPDAYDVAVSSVWTTTVSAPPSLWPGENTTLAVTVTVPGDAGIGDVDTAVITLTSQGDPAQSDSAQITTTSITGWMEATPLDNEIGSYGFAQCPNDPNGFYLFGGLDDGYFDDGHFITTTLYYDAVSENWQELASMPFAMIFPSAVCYQEKIYLAGGNSEQGYIDNLLIYDTNTMSWTYGADIPRLVIGAAMAAWDGKLYLVGGTDTPAWEGLDPVNQVDIYDIATNIWDANAGPQMPVAASIPGYTQAGPYLYLVGGFSGDFDHNVIATQRLDLSTMQWELGPELLSARAIINTPITEHHLYAIGGNANGGDWQDSTNLVEVLDLTAWPDGTWQDLEDPLPNPSQSSVSNACTDIPGGGRIWSVGGVNGNLSPWDIFDTNLYHPVGEFCIQYIVNLPDEPMQGVGEIGQTVNYTLSITNAGTITDYYNLTISTTWQAGSPLDILGPIGPGETIQVVIGVDIPDDANPGDIGLSTVMIESLRDPNIMDTILITTTVGLRDFDLQAIPPDSQQGHPGDILTYTLQVSNIGDFEDSYNVEISATWVTTAALTVGPLLPGENGELSVVVTIPQDAQGGGWDYALVTLSSQIKPLIAHSATLTSTAIWYRTLLPLALKN